MIPVLLPFAVIGFAFFALLAEGAVTVSQELLP